MKDFQQKYIESLNYVITDRIRGFLEELEYPHNVACVRFIRDNWIKDHKEAIEEAWEDETTFEIDSNDVTLYWMNYVTHLMHSV